MSERPGILLAGGLSRRMGENKALLPFGDGRLIDHVARRLSRECDEIALNVNAALAGLDDLPRVADDIPGFAGPLAGIAAGLAHFRGRGSAATHLLSVAADTPFFPSGLRAALQAAATGPDEIAVSVDPEGNWHPVFALWPFALEEDLRGWLADPENRRLKAFILRHRHRTVTFPLIRTPEAVIDPFFNVNTPADYRRAIALRDRIT